MAFGRCHECGATVETGHSRCPSCVDHRSALREDACVARATAGLCIACGDPPAQAVAGSRCLRHFFDRIAAVTTFQVRAKAVITGATLHTLWKDQRGLCAYTGLPLVPGAGKDKPLAASLDREFICSEGDAALPTLRWVASGVRSIKGSLSDGEFRHILGESGMDRLAAIMIDRDAASKGDAADP
jgi:hypothetical protein